MRKQKQRGDVENFFVTVGELRLKKESHHGVYARREWSGSLSLRATGAMGMRK